MTHLKTAAALCGGVTALVMGIGLSDVGAVRTTSAASSSVSPAPPSPANPGGALPVRPAGGGGCIIGMNCGCIRNITCPKPHARHPGVVGDPQRGGPAPAPQNP